MKPSIRFISLFVLLIFFSASFAGAQKPGTPVTPKASPEAKALLNLFYSISGKYTLTGQHNYPSTKDQYTLIAAEYIGKTPVVFSTDWGFAKENDKDSYLARPKIVKEAIRQHNLGSIITICWHAVPPTAKEPITFQPVPGTNPPALASVQGRLTDQQFQDILTPGTLLYRSWCAQVDSIAHYLKLLQDAHVPVLWRPYHEMNGSWFWWGARLGKYSTQALYRQLFNRLVKYHKLNNLIWVWSVDRPNKPEMKFTNYYPGNDYLDIVALDVYGSDFNQAYYDSLLVLSKGKPMVLAEVGNPPTPEILSKQPKWAYYSIWAGFEKNTSKEQYRILTGDPRILSLEDPAFREAIASYRKACGLQPLSAQNNSQAGQTGTFKFSDIRWRDMCVMPDPATKTYYIVGPGRRGVRAYTSKDLINWTGPQMIYNAPDSVWGNIPVVGIWAPEMHFYKGKYYLFLTFDTRNKFPEQWRDWLLRVTRGSQVLVSDSPTGPFKTFQNHSTLPADMMTLDGTLWAEDGTPYMIFCHEWVQISDGAVEYVRLKDDLSETAGEPKKLFRGSQAPWGKISDTYGCYVTDGPFLHMGKTGKLYMIWTSGGKDGNAMGIAISESGKLAGPWRQQEEPVYKANGGHGMLFNTFDGKLMLILHSPYNGDTRPHLFEMEDTGETLKIVKEIIVN